MSAPIHLMKLHWRAVLAVITLAVLLWFCVPARLRATLSENWKKFGHAVGNVQARALLTLVYAVLILPFGLAVRFFSDSMHTKKRAESWFDHPATPNTLEEARRQG